MEVNSTDTPTHSTPFGIADIMSELNVPIVAENAGKQLPTKTELISEETRVWIDANRYEVAPGDSIAIMCYGDHDLDPFKNFIKNIVPDNSQVSLFEMIKQELSLYENEKLKKNGKSQGKNYRKWTVRKLVKRFEDKRYKANIPWMRLICGCLCIKATVGGLSYIICNGFSRSDYSSIHRTLSKGKHKWKINHSVLCTHYLQSTDTAFDDSMFALDNERFKKQSILWAPGGAKDFLAAAYVSDNQIYNFWNALTK